MYHSILLQGYHALVNTEENSICYYGSTHNERVEFSPIGPHRINFELTGADYTSFFMMYKYLGYPAFFNFIIRKDTLSDQEKRILSFCVNKKNVICFSLETIITNVEFIHQISRIANIVWINTDINRNLKLIEKTIKEIYVLKRKRIRWLSNDIITIPKITISEKTKENDIQFINQLSQSPLMQNVFKFELGIPGLSQADTATYRADTELYRTTLRYCYKSHIPITYCECMEKTAQKAKIHFFQEKHFSYGCTAYSFSAYIDSQYYMYPCIEYKNAQLCEGIPLLEMKNQKEQNFLIDIWYSDYIINTRKLCKKCALFAH